MSPRLAHYGLLWRAALAQTHPRAHAALLWLTPILAMAAALLGWKVDGGAAAARWGCNTVAACVLTTWTWGYMRGAFRLNTPANAQLTPGMRARLVELGMAVWLAAIVGLALANAGHPPGIALPVLWFMLASLGMGLAATGSSAGSWILIAIWPLMGLQSLVPGGVRLAMGHPAFLPLAALLLAAPGLATIHAMLPRAGDRHMRLLAKRASLLDKGGLGNQGGGAFIGWWQARSLHRASGRRDLGGMLLHGGGPGLQLGVTVLCILGMGLLGLVLLGFIHMSGRDDARQLAIETGWIWSLAPLFMFQLHAMLLGSLADAPAGQPLLRLAPAMPASAPHFNRLLASTVLRSSLAAWAVATATAFACAFLSGAARQELVLVASLCCLALPVLVLPLRDHARRPRWNPVLQWLLVMGLAGACLLLAVLARRLVDMPVFATAAVLAIVLTVGLALRRHAHMVRAPFAFPAGRLD